MARKKAKSDRADQLKRLNKRLGWVKVLMFATLAFLIYRIGYFKVVKGAEFEKEVRARMMSTDQEIEALRGTIVDRNNKTLAASTLVYNIILDPQAIEELADKPKQNTYEGLAEYSGKSVTEITSLIQSNQNLRYKIFMKSISAEDMQMLKGKKMKGVRFEETFTRQYPQNELAAQTIGFYNKQEGQYGVEQSYNTYMLGQPGRVFSQLQQKDMITTQVAGARNGNTVVLTIDEVIQQYVEQVMNKYVKEWKPLNAAAIVMNPKTGEIYAMYSYPYYDPNTYTNLEKQMGKATWDALSGEQQTEALNQAWKNYNIQNPYEPGSTFKPLVIAEAVEEGLIDLNTQYNCTGINKVGLETIRCWKRQGHGIQTLEQALANSCNTAMIEISKKIPAEIFHKYFIKFGFSEATGVDLPGEAKGIIHSLNNLGPVQEATSSMGQSFTVTPLQLVTALSSLLNGGYLMEPYVVSQVVDEQNHLIVQNEPSIKRQIFSKETSTLVKDYMESVVKKGTGINAAIPGYSVGGKTGTAQKLPREAGKHILSFAGFAPVDDPQVLTLVLFDEIPEDAGITPLAFKEIMENVLPYMGIEATGDTTTPVNDMAVVPAINGLELIDAATRIEAENLDYEVIGVGSKVTNQYPAEGTKLPYDSKVKIYVESDQAEETIEVPELVGLTLEEAKKVIEGQFVLQGAESGMINHQIPKAGTKMEKEQKIFVQTVQ